MKRTLLLLCLLTLAGCKTVLDAPPEGLDQRAVYQTIANALPEAEFGWGQPPGIVEMSASAKAEGETLAPEALKATERGFRVRYKVYRPKTAWIPYSAIKEVSYEYKTFPNVIFAALIIVPLQMGRATIVFDANEVPGLISSLKSDISRLESISREIGMGGPYSHAQTVKWKIEDDAVAHGSGMLALHFDFGSGVPSWIPYGGTSKTTAEAFAWAKANPDAPELPDEPEPAPAAGEETPQSE